MALTLMESAALLARLYWFEQRCFEVLGSWVASTPEPAIKAMLGVQSGHHGWHAELFEARFPRGYDADFAVQTAAAAQDLGPVLSALASPTDTVSRLAGFYRAAVPAKVAVYNHWLECSSTLAESPVQRSLKMVLHDEVTNWQQAEMALDSLIVEADQLDLAGIAQRQVAFALLKAGGLAGGMNWGQVSAR